jgi:hypothetical protein
MDKKGASLPSCQICMVHNSHDPDFQPIRMKNKLIQ